MNKVVENVEVALEGLQDNMTVMLCVCWDVT